MPEAVLYWVMQAYAFSPHAWHAVGPRDTMEECQTEAKSQNAKKENFTLYYICEPRDWTPAKLEEFDVR